MRVFVLGGTGFIGRRVVGSLSGHEVTVFHRGSTNPDWSHVHHLYGDRAELASHRAALRALAPDVVLDMIPRNGSDARAVIAGVRGIAERVVAVSSGSVYRSFGVLTGVEAGAIENTPSREDSPLRATLFPYQGRGPASLNDYDKIPAECAFLNEPELHCSIVRLPMVYGPGDPDQRLVPYVSRMVDRRPDILLQETVARWRNARAYVDNAAAAIALVVELGAPGRVYNVAEPNNFSEAEWVRRIGRAVGWSGEIRTVPDGGTVGRPSVSELPLDANFAQHLTMDTSRIREELGFTEVVPVESALGAAAEDVARSLAVRTTTGMKTT